MRQAKHFLDLLTKAHPIHGDKIGCHHALTLLSDGRLHVTMHFDDHWLGFVMDEEDLDSPPDLVVASITMMIPEAEHRYQEEKERLQREKEGNKPNA